ncbi:hypothetical protein [Aerococcus sp. Group 1]|uniref:hypothetical protein n=1 Tax=Aerococcus urinae (strain CCUG 59500 / ACS-120-V-Col10a) TaxID=2976812 RepID=UPI0005A07E60|nr:hypothetical protein [Aerococcus sp. Group 1]
MGLGILLGGTYEILKEKKRNEEIRNLKRRINRLGRCHNEFVMYQGEYNDRNEEKQEELEERISYLEEETISNYDHILELSKEEVEGD